MKLPIASTCTKSRHTTRSLQQGSLIVEAMLAIALLASFVISALSLVWSARVMRPLLDMRSQDIVSLDLDVSKWQNTTTHQGFVREWSSDYGEKIYPLGTTSPISTFALNSAVMLDAGIPYSIDSCAAAFRRNIDIQPTIYSAGISQTNLLPSDVFITDMVVRNGYVYLTTDSSVQARSDVYIYDDRLPDNPVQLSSIHTGPGANAFVVSGHFIYVANTSTTNQLQIIDIADRSSPLVVARLKLPLPEASSTAPAATAITYSNGFVYLGTEKWAGAEFSIIDVRNPLVPVFVSGIEIGAVVKSIVVRDGIAYVANAGSQELIMIDAHDSGNPAVIGSFSPTGSQIEEGNRVMYHHGNVWFGRAGGGFNTSSYQELFSFVATSSRGMSDLIPAQSSDVAGGVYGVVAQDPYVFVASGDAGGALEIWKHASSSAVLQKVSSNRLGLSTHPVILTCDGNDLYVATTDTAGFIRITFPKK